MKSEYFSPSQMFVNTTVLKHLQKRNEQLVGFSRGILLTSRELLLVYAIEIKIRPISSLIFLLAYPVWMRI